MPPSHPSVEVRLVRDAEIGAVRELVSRAYAGDFELNPAYLAEIERVAERARSAEVWVAADRATGALLGTVTTPLPGERLSPVAWCSTPAPRCGRRNGSTSVWDSRAWPTGSIASSEPTARASS
jgi:hypothetical protein